MAYVKISVAEAADRAKFLLQRHGKLTVSELVQFCGGPSRLSPIQAFDVLVHEGRQVSPDEFVPHPSVQQAAQQAAQSQAQQGMQHMYNQMLNNLASPLQVTGAPGGLTAFVTGSTAGTAAPPEKKAKSPFKKGDRVEVVSDRHEGIPVGSLGTIERLYTDGSGCDVFIDGVEGGSYPYVFESLKLYNKPKVTIDSVVLKPEKKEEIRAAIAQHEHTSLIFDKWGFGEVFEKGTAISLLFWGVPGTGKTLMAQAIADEFDADLKIYSTADIQSSEPGGAERMIRTIFKEASKKNKAKGRSRVILFDECDSLLMDRNEVGAILGAEVNALLTEIETYEGIVIFTTNRLGKLDPALERRLSAKIEFEFPDKKARLAIWERMIPKQAPLHTDVNFSKLAEFSIAGGNIKNAVLNAARHAAYKGHDKIAHQHFEDAVKREVASQKAFQDEYKKQTHQAMHGYARGKEGITVDRGVDKEMSINKTLHMGAKDEDI